MRGSLLTLNNTETSTGAFNTDLVTIRKAESGDGADDLQRRQAEHSRTATRCLSLGPPNALMDMITSNPK
jgi:hypothetical protein